MAGSQDDIPPPPPPPSQTPTQQTPHTVSTIKLPILKKGEYDIWAMKMEHYLAHTDYPIWEVIQNGNGPVSITTDTQGQIKVLPPRTAEEILARERERKARTTLLMALPEDHLAKFHKMTDAKEMWEAIKSRFGGNDESKKMQKYILKQQFEGFSVSNSEGLHKGYDRFQSLLSQLEIHGAGVSTEDANQKFLRSLPSAWSQVSLIMRTKPGVDSLSFDDLYNNLRVFENDVKGSTASSSSTQNVAFVSENTSSTNDVSTAYGVSNPSGQNSQYEHTSSYSLLANQSSCPQLDHEMVKICDPLRTVFGINKRGIEKLLIIAQQQQQQPIIPADQLVSTKYQGIGRCNNYAMLQNIPCSVECKIVGQILIDHDLSYALNATLDVSVVYLQQFWKTVSKVDNTKDTIHFMLDRKEITYTVDMFRSTLQLPVKTPNNPFIIPTTLEYIQPFMKIIGYQRDVDKLIIADLMKKLPSIPQRLEEYYHFIKDDIPLVSVYTTGNVTVRGILILDEFFTDNIRATEEYKEYEKIESGSHKKNPEIVGDDDVNEYEKKDEKKDDNDDDVNDDHTDQTLDKTQETGSLETRNAKMQTL
ncbi:hypothetical protein Tco_0363446 [Tanacetum coccineum]